MMRCLGRIGAPVVFSCRRTYEIGDLKNEVLQWGFPVRRRARCYCTAVVGIAAEQTVIYSEEQVLKVCIAFRLLLVGIQYDVI